MAERDPQPLASPVADASSDPREIAMAGASAAGGCVVDFAEIARYGSVGSGELVETACDVAKLAIEACGGPADEDQNQVYGALCKFLEGWAG